MIYTLTLNPSIDYVMEINEIKVGATNYSEKEYMLPGGKGINVSRVLNQLEIPNEATGFIGGHTGKFIEEWLSEEQANFHFIQVEGDTRINVKLKGENETEINGRGPAITEKDIQKLLERIQKLTADDTLIISGSKNKGLPETFYIDIIKILEKNNVPFVIDTNSKELLEALEYKPFLVKPNQVELNDLFDATVYSIEEAVHYGKKLQKMGAQNVIVSFGGAGAVFVDQDDAYIAEAPQGEVVNTVGSGDSMIAGFLAGIDQGLSKLEAFKLGIQCGSATAFTEDLATKEEILALNNQVITRKVE